MRKMLCLWMLILCLLPCAALAQHVMVDFDLLTALNPDCKGWIYQEESGLSTHIMQSSTQPEDWYRERGFDEIKIYQTGSVYLEQGNSLHDDVVTLFGQARDEGCFSVIDDYADQSVFESRSPLLLLTPEGNWQAEVFACVNMLYAEIDSWMRQPEESFGAWIGRVKEGSLIQASLTPQEGSRILVAVGERFSNNCYTVYALLTPASDAPGQAVDLTKRELDNTQTQNGYAEVPSVGRMMIYAQNDELYREMRYESTRGNTYRDFEGGGCGPTAAAIAIAYLVEEEELPKIGQFAKNELGNLFCSCSVNRVICSHMHPPYHPVTPQEYKRYLPVVIADFAAGNNIWDINARRLGSTGTNMRFISAVCGDVYGLQVTPVEGLANGLDALRNQEGKGVVICAALRGSPLTNSSHYVVIAGVDEEYFYVIDPLRRTEEEYRKTDRRHILELVAPSIVRISLENAGRSDLSPLYHIAR